MVINSYTYIYLLIVFLTGFIWGIIMLLLDINLKRSMYKEHDWASEIIINTIINNNNNICINDYNINSTENLRDNCWSFKEFINEELFNNIEVG